MKDEVLVEAAKHLKQKFLTMKALAEEMDTTVPRATRAFKALIAGGWQADMRLVREGAAGPISKAYRLRR